MKSFTTEKIPTWAVAYIAYGDYSELSDEEIKEVDDWIGSSYPNGFTCDFGDCIEIFSPSPAFGKPCSVIYAKFYEL